MTPAPNSRVPFFLRVLTALVAVGVLFSAYPAFRSAGFHYVAVTAVFVIVLAATLLPMSLVAKQVALTLSLLIALNLLTTPLFRATHRTLVPNHTERVRFVGSAMPGFNGVHTITTDAEGYRTNTPVDYNEKPARTLRLFAIGGSTTEQIHLDDQKTWVSLLANGLSEVTARRVEAVNTGVSGLRAEHHLATLLRIADYQPDVVIIMLGINDWNQHVRTRERRHVEYFDTLFDRLDLKESPLARAWRYLAAPVARRPDVTTLNRVREEDGSYFRKQNDSLNRAQQREFYPREVSRSYASDVQAIAETCRDYSITCLLTDQPTAYHRDISTELRRRLWMTPPDEQYTLPLENMIHLADLYNGWLRDFSAAVDMPFCGVAAKMPPSTEFFFDDCHFNEAGAARVARLLSECVLSQKLIS